MSIDQDHLDGLICATEDGVLFHLPWGFTLYRTEYGGPSESRWQILVDAMQTQVVAKLAPHGGGNEGEDEDDGDGDDGESPRAALLRLFRLDMRSDAAALQGRPLDALRAQFLDGARATDPEMALAPQQRVFLLADAEVLGDNEAFSDGPGGIWVKAVQADYAAANYTPRDARLGPQRYFGWMKMRADAVLGLWRALDRHEMASVAPLTIGGMHLVTWDGDDEE